MACPRWSTARASSTTARVWSLFAIAVGVVYAPTTPLDAVVAFAGTIALSVLIGAVTGFVAARVTTRVDDHLIELTLTVVLAYGSYLLAD